MDNTCSEHSGVCKNIEGLRRETDKQDKIISRMDAKLNMIIGAIILSPFIWSLLIGVTKFKG